MADERASNLYTGRLKEPAIRTNRGSQIRMSGEGNPYDDAFFESFVGTLKVEEVYLNEYDDMQEAIENLVPFLEDVHNRKRLRCSPGYRGPIGFERELSLNTDAELIDGRKGFTPWWRRGDSAISS